MSSQSHSVPIGCDPRGAPDTAEERIDEYRQLFRDAFVGRERTEAGVRFRFRAGEGMEARVRDLADREKECCAFFTFTVALIGGEVLWDAAVVDDDTARTLLDQWYALPDVVDEGVQAMHDRWLAAGRRFLSDPLTRVPESEIAGA